MMDDKGWKLIWGQDTLLKHPKPELTRQIQLFNTFDDPAEMFDMADEKPEIVNRLKTRILEQLQRFHVPADWPSGNSFKQSQS